MAAGPAVGGPPKSRSATPATSTKTTRPAETTTPAETAGAATLVVAATSVAGILAVAATLAAAIPDRRSDCEDAGQRPGRVAGPRRFTSAHTTKRANTRPIIPIVNPPVGPKMAKVAKGGSQK